MTLVYRKYLPNNVGTHLRLSKLRQIGVNEIAYAAKANHARSGDRTEYTLTPKPRPLLSPSHSCCLFPITHTPTHLYTPQFTQPQRIVRANSITRLYNSPPSNTKTPAMLRQQFDDLVRGARNEGVWVRVLVLWTPDGAVHLLVGFAQQIDGTLLHRIPVKATFICSTFIKSNLFCLYTT